MMCVCVCMCRRAVDCVCVCGLLRNVDVCVYTINVKGEIGHI